jgi:hypothetical protein
MMMVPEAVIGRRRCGRPQSWRLDRSRSAVAHVAHALLQVLHAEMDVKSACRCSAREAENMLSFTI